jgi:hypothetical protein
MVKSMCIFSGLLVAKFIYIYIYIVKIFPYFGYWNVAQKCEGILNFFLLSYPVYSQIWLNFIVDDCPQAAIDPRESVLSLLFWAIFSKLANFFFQKMPKHECFLVFSGHQIFTVYSFKITPYFPIGF